MDILLLDDDVDSRRYLVRFLERLGHRVEEYSDGQAGVKAFMSGHFSMVLSDIIMPQMTGIDFLQSIAGHTVRGDASIILMTAHANTETAISALRLGAYDYLTKPINLDELAAIVERVADYQGLRRDHRRLSEDFNAEVRVATQESQREVERLRNIVARTSGLRIGIFSQQMQQLTNQALKYHTDRSIPVLIEGETGTGKEIIAQMIHNGDGLNSKPFIDINCTALTASLFESEIFGYESGAFTGGLTKGQKGKLDIAAGGTLFLDEVGDMPLELQGKLLRVLEEKEFYRVGGLKKVKTDVRIVCATNVGLAQRVEQGIFRKDLYYRLNIGHIIIPPLRERVEGIAALAQMFLEGFAVQKKKHFKRISNEAVKVLESYNWPGNVRELRNVIDWVTFMYDEVEVKPAHLRLNGQEKTVRTQILPVGQPSKEEHLDGLIVDALEKCGGNKTAAAQSLKMSRRAFCYRLEKIKQS